MRKTLHKGMWEHAGSSSSSLVMLSSLAGWLHALMWR